MEREKKLIEKCVHVEYKNQIFFSFMTIKIQMMIQIEQKTFFHCFVLIETNYVSHSGGHLKKFDHKRK